MEQPSEKRRHERKDYHFNVVLVGRNGVQRGCRVLNVSQTGMMLMWNSRKEDPEIKGPGLLYPVDTDVGILFIAGKSEKRTISLNARVLWAEWNLIGIEFHDPDPELMNMLAFEFAVQRPYFVLGEREKDTPVPLTPPTEQEKPRRPGKFLKGVIGAAVLGAAALLLTVYFSDPSDINGSDPSREEVAGAITDPSKQWQSDIIVPIPESVRAKRKPVAPLVVMVDAPAEGAKVSGDVMVHVSTGGDTAPTRVELHVGDALVDRREAGPFLFRLNSLDYPDGSLELRVVAHDENGNQVAYGRRLVVENTPALLTPQPGEILSTAENEAPEGDAVATADQEESGPSETVGDEARGAETPRDIDVPRDAFSGGPTGARPSTPTVSAETAPPSAPETVEPATASPPAPTTDDQPSPQPELAGAWYINLITLSNRPAAEKFASEGRNYGFPVVVEPARIRGRDLWRLRLYGFESKQAARDYGTNVQEKMGLDEILIRRRK